MIRQRMATAGRPSRHPVRRANRLFRPEEIGSSALDDPPGDSPADPVLSSLPRPADGRFDRPLPVEPASDPRPRVCKWGGTSMADVEVVRFAARHAAELARERPVVMVVSALGGVTDALEALLERAATHRHQPVDLRELRSRHRRHLRALSSDAGESFETRARVLERHLERLARLLGVVRWRGSITAADRAAVLSMGERLAAELFVDACRDSVNGVQGVELVDPHGLLAVEGSLDDGHGDVAATRERYDALAERGTALSPGRTWVVPGFFGSGADGRLRLLGRGGSDTAATLLGAALGADRVEIWTDVDGVYPRDPRHDSGARPFARLGFDEAERLAMAGARVLHSRSMAPVRAARVPVVVRNSFRPQVSGTWIGPLPEQRPEGHPDALAEMSTLAALFADAAPEPDSREGAES